MGIVSRSQGGSGSGSILFDSTLGADAASIDTGANGIAQTLNVIEVWIVARTDDAAAESTVDIIVNNDASAIYDAEVISALNVTAAATPSLAQTQWRLQVHGAGGSATYPGIVRLTVPAYAQTTFFKIAEAIHGQVDATAANDRVRGLTLGYRATTAISRMKVTASGGSTVLKAGSRLLILGR